jgi:hypothetical protein
MGPRKKAGKPGNEQAAPDEEVPSRRAEIRENLFQSYQKNQKEATPENIPPELDLTFDRFAGDS